MPKDSKSTQEGQRPIKRKPASRAGNASGRKELKKSAGTRKKILDAAAKLFAEKGYGKTLMSDISDEAGIHITGLYYHFNLKDDLAEKVLSEVINVTHNTILDKLKTFDANCQYEDKIRHLVYEQMKIVREYNVYALAQRRVIRELPADAQSRQLLLIHNLADLWLEILHEGREIGKIRKDVDIKIVQIVLLGAFDWSVETYKETGLKIKEISDGITDILLCGSK